MPSLSKSLGKISAGGKLFAEGEGGGVESEIFFPVFVQANVGFV